MTKNTKGGKHHKKQKRTTGQKEDGKLLYAEENQIYATVVKKVGGSRMLVLCSDTIERSGLIPGKLFKRVWLGIGDILLCELNLEDDSQCYITHKYSNKHANMLKAQGKITFNINDEEDEVNAGYGFEDQEVESSFLQAGKMLDINNVKSNNDSIYPPSDSDELDDLIKNPNHDRVISKKISRVKLVSKQQESDNGDDDDNNKNITLADL